MGFRINGATPEEMEAIRQGLSTGNFVTSIPKLNPVGPSILAQQELPPMSDNLDLPSVIPESKPHELQSFSDPANSSLLPSGDGVLLANKNPEPINLGIPNLNTLDLSPKDTSSNSIVKNIAKKMNVPQQSDKMDSISLPQSSALQGEQLGSNQALKDAQSKENTLRTVHNMGRAGSAYAALMGGLGKDWVDNLHAGDKDQEAAPVKQYSDQISNQKNDPNSTASIAYRDAAKKMGFNLPENASASDIEKQFPIFERFMASKESNATRRDIAEQNAANRALQIKMHSDNMALAKGTKQEADDEKMLRRHLNDLQGQIDKRRGYIGGYTNTLQQGEKLNQMLSKYKGNLDNVPVAMIPEIIGAMDTMITGNSTVSGRSHLESALSSLQSKWQSGLQKVTNQSEPAKLGNLLKPMLSSVHREDELARNKLKSHINAYEKRLPESYLSRGDNRKAFRDALGSMTGMIGEDSQYSEDVVEYAKAHNISPEEAQHIKESRGGK